MIVKIIQIDYEKEKQEKKLDKSSVLRLEAKKVPHKEFATKELQEILKNMESAMNQEKDGVALAAPQIGISKRIFIIREKVYSKKAKWKPLIFINPILIKVSKKIKAAEEGCLSVRPFYGITFRHSSVTIEAQDFQGQKFSFGASGLLSQICQHETEHLNGILFIDHAENLQKIIPNQQQ